MRPAAEVFVSYVHRQLASEAEVAFLAVSDDYTPSQVWQLLSDENVQLIDVRQTDEHEAGHIAGSRLIELADLPVQAATIDRDRPVILYCRSGARSEMATEALLQAGYDAHNMSGGMLEWQAAGLEMEPADGHVL
jgi:rhodanese-related sulfurtransferase